MMLGAGSLTVVYSYENRCRRVSIKALQVDNNLIEEEWSVGESPNQYGFGGSRESFNKDVLHRWEQEMGV